MRELVITKSISERQERSLDRYFTDLKKIEIISGQEEIVLARRIKSGDEQALVQLVNSNLRFVISVAKQFQHQGVDLGDLVNEGNLGLITAAKKFDETKGYKFISYAVWWIRQAIMSAVAEQSRTIHIPYNFVALKSKVKKATQKLEQILTRDPSLLEISLYLNVEEEKIRDLFAYDRKQLSIDKPLNKDTQTPLLETVRSHEFSPDKAVLLESLKQEIHSAIAILNSRDRDIISLHFGLNRLMPMQLEDIASSLNLSTEHIRRIKDQALEKIKRSSHGTMLRLYLC